MKNEMDVTQPGGTLSREMLRRMDAYWRAANYLSVGQIYLLDNPLLKKRLTLDQVKPRLVRAARGQDIFVADVLHDRHETPPCASRKTYKTASAPHRTGGA